MRTLALTVAYDGTDWAGFQRQPGHVTIQAQLEAALSLALQHPVEVAAAGRTDAGVHALGQIISFTTLNPLPIERVPRIVNNYLPATIRVRRARVMPTGFHARWWASSRRYRYLLHVTRQPDPIRGRFCWQVPPPLDVEAMLRASRACIGRQDFAAFCQNWQPGQSTMRTVTRLAVQPLPGGYVQIDVQADAFLHRMVRLLVAQLRLVGGGIYPDSWPAQVLASRNRQWAGKGAPATGLILMRIGYPPVADSFSPLGESVGDECHEEFSG